MGSKEAWKYLDCCDIRIIEDLPELHVVPAYEGVVSVRGL